MSAFGFMFLSPQFPHLKEDIQYLSLGGRWVISLNTMMSNYINFLQTAWFSSSLWLSKTLLCKYFIFPFKNSFYLLWLFYMCVVWRGPRQLRELVLPSTIWILRLEPRSANLHSRCFYFRVTFVTHTAYFLYPYICLWVPRRAPCLVCYE